MFSRIYDSVKGVASSTFTAVKKYYKPVGYMVGRFIGSGGGVILGARSLANKIWGATHNNAPAPPAFSNSIQLYAVISNMTINAMRMPALFALYGEPDSDINNAPEAAGEAVNLLSHDAHDEMQDFTEYPDWTLPEFNKKENASLIFLRSMLYSSLVFNFTNTLYSAINVFELCAEIFANGATLNLTTVALTTQLLFMVYIAFSNANMFRALNIPIALNNVINLIKKIKTDGFTYDTVLGLTSVLSLNSLIATVFGAYYGTSNAFFAFRKKYSILQSFLSDGVIKILTLASTTSAVVAECASKSFSLYRLIGKNVEKIRHRFFRSNNIEAPNIEVPKELPSYWLKLKIATMKFGVSNAAFAGSVNISSIPYVFAQLSAIDPDNPWLRAFAIGTAFSSFAMELAFTWETTNQTEDRLAANIKKALEIEQKERLYREMEDGEVVPSISNENILDNREESHSGFVDIAKPSATSYKNNCFPLFGDCINRKKTATELEDEYHDLAQGAGVKYLS